MSNIYFAQCGNQIKVGIAINVRKRLSGLQVASPLPITLLGSIAGDRHVEKTLHEQLRGFHVRGEWFRDCQEVRDIIKRATESHDAVPFVENHKAKPGKFGAVARVIWPTKTSAHVAAIAGVDDRTAKRWLSGQYDPPAVVVAALISEIFKRE